MPQRPFRFLHAADFRLEEPLSGLAEVPDELRDLLVEAPLLAARQAFDTALSEEVDFVVLAGALADLQQAGPQVLLFFAEQLGRLAEKGIAVYWAGGPGDPPESWPAWLALPENVRRFPRGRIEHIVHHRDAVPLAKIIGTSRDPKRAVSLEEMQLDPAGLFTVGVLYGEFAPDLLRAQELSYWALGGKPLRSTLFSTPQVAHYPGGPQGLHPAAGGAHGCTLVQVDEQAACRITLMPTDAVRWHQQRLTIEPSTTEEDLRALLRDQVQTLLESVSSRAVLAAWTIAGQGPLLSQLRRGALAGQLLGWLREEYRRTSPCVWTISVEAESTATLPAESYEQETILGDFLHQVRHYQMNDREPLYLDPYIHSRHQAGTLGDRLDLSAPETRRHVLGEAALLGADLLKGEEPQS